MLRKNVTHQPIVIPTNWEKTPLPASDIPYPCIIQDVQHNPEQQSVLLHICPIAGRYAGVYEGINAFVNRIYLKYDNAKSGNMTRKRLGAISESNENFDALEAFQDGDLEAFIGKKLGVIYKRGTDKRTGQQTCRTHSVVPIYMCVTDGEQAPTLPQEPKQLIKFDDNFVASIRGEQVFVDFRQKEGKHDVCHNRLRERYGLNLETVRLNVGDYMPLNGHVTVDTKTIGEWADNIDTSDIGRIRQECERARKFGIKLVFVVSTEKENIPAIEQSVKAWKHPRCRSCFGHTCHNGSGEKHAEGVCPLYGTPPVDGETIISAMEKLVRDFRPYVNVVVVPTEGAVADVIVNQLFTHGHGGATYA